ncbi:MAG: hypothetical protein ACRENS_12215 [Candidatus Eiseniibacteriota bacterium]
MSWMLPFAGMTLGGWIGWALGQRFGMFAAYLLSVVFSAIALYWCRRIARDLLR